ncbi:hypothetical protein G6F68_012180 [Rhizopus microsporus]|nr:hypothetical protein G6F68_012180 [Rhizopus microsporus]
MGHGGDHLAHALQGGLVDVQPIDGVHVDQHHMPGQGPLDDAVMQLLAARGGELLGIIQAVDAWPCRVKHHRGNGHRPGQRAAPGLVNACDQALGLDHGRAIEQGQARRRGVAPAHALAWSRISSSPTASAARALQVGRALRMVEPLLDGRRQLVRRAVVLHQFRGQILAGQDVGKRETVDLDQAQRLDQAVGQLVDAVADHHRALDQHRFQRGGARGQHDDVGGDHRVARLAVEYMRIGHRQRRA